MKSLSTILFGATTVALLHTAVVTPAMGGSFPETAAAIPDSVGSVADSMSYDENDFTDLEELVVTQRQKLVKSDGATLTYTVSEDPEAASSNTLEILRKVPGVTVDAEDNVKVNGQSNFKILLNGREDPMLKGDIKSVLKSMPANSIKKIEVISEPGAKYDAEGVGGILNIVTDKSRSLSGYLTQLSAWMNAYQAGGYVNGRAKIDKVMLDATVSYNNGKVWPRTYRSERSVEALDDSENHLMTARQESRNGWDYAGALLNMSWEPDTLNLFTLSANYGYNSWENKGSETRDMRRPDLSPLWTLRRDFDLEGNYNGIGAQISYQHNFLREDHNITASYQFNHTRQKSVTDYLLEYIEGSGEETPYSSDRSRGSAVYHIAQLDYSNRFSPRHLLEAGGKVFLNTNGSHSTPLFGPDAADAVADPTLELEMRQLINVYALYGSYSGTFSKWNVKGGLRYEYTYMGGRYQTGGYPDFTTRLNDIVPNGAVSYNLTDASSLRLAYQMRISRPDISQINPFVNTLTPGQISYGNPDLKSQRGHTFSMSYSNYEGKLSGSAKLSYRYVSNGVNDVIFMRDGVMNSSYANIGRSHTATLDLSADWTIIPALRWGVYASGSYMHMAADSELLKARNHGWQTYLTTNLNYTAGKWRLSGYGGFFTPWIDLQGRGTSNSYYYGLGASRSWLKDDALTLQLSAGNLLPYRKKSSYLQEDETVRLRYFSRNSQWNAGVSISFKFGGLTARVRQTAASIEKEETSSGGSKGGN